MSRAGSTPRNLYWSLRGSPKHKRPATEFGLEGTHQDDVPVHPAAGDTRYVRWANATIATVVSIDGATGWIEIESATKRGFVTRRYLVVLPPDPDPDDPGAELLTGLVLMHWTSATTTSDHRSRADGRPPCEPHRICTTCWVSVDTSAWVIHIALAKLARHRCWPSAAVPADWAGTPRWLRGLAAVNTDSALHCRRVTLNS